MNGPVAPTPPAANNLPLPLPPRRAVELLEEGAGYSGRLLSLHKALHMAWNVHRREKERVLQKTLGLIRRMLDGDGDFTELARELSLEHGRALRKRVGELHIVR